MLSPAGIKSLDISKDGTKLLALHGQKPSGMTVISVIDLHNQATIQTFSVSSVIDPDYAAGLPMDVYAAEWGSNTSEIVYVSSGHLKRYNLAKGEVSIIISCPLCFMATLHDSQKAAFLQTTTGINLVVVADPYAGGEGGKVVATNALNGLGFSPDGLKIAYSTESEEAGAENGTFTSTVFSTRIVVVDLSTGISFHTASDAIFKPAWLDNESILVPDSTQMKLWRLNVRSNQRQLFLDLGAITRQSGRVAGLAISPDQQFIAYQVFREGIFEDLYVLDVACIRKGE